MIGRKYSKGLLGSIKAYLGTTWYYQRHRERALESDESGSPRRFELILVFLYMAFQGCGKFCADALRLITQIRDINFAMNLPMV